MIGFALDMDGTIYHGDRPVPGAMEFINSLKERGIPFKFITNNSSHTCAFYADRLVRMGFDIDVRDVLTSTTATVRFLKEHRAGKNVYIVATPDVTREILDAGITEADGHPDIVLLTYDIAMTYEKLNNIYQYLKTGSELIVTHPDDVCPTEAGYDLDMGPFIRMFQQFTERPITVVGKPHSLMLEMAALEMGLKTDDIIMVGDRLYTDMCMAIDAGIRSILVLTGEATRESLKESGMEPTYVLDSVGDIDLDVL